MFFLGDFLGSSESTVACTPTNIENITRIELSNSWYDFLKVTHNIDDELSNHVNLEWDKDTILLAKFDENASAGNVNWSIDEVSHLLIKRKKIGDFKWITLEAHPIETVEDFNIKNIDLTAVPNYEYMYAAVPIIEGVEGFYSTDTVDIKTDSLFIADSDEVWTTVFNDNYLDSNAIMPLNTSQTMYSKFPTFVRNSVANYEEISVSAKFFPFNEKTYDYDVYDDRKRIEYHNKAKAFLRNGKVKILKSMDGRVWMVYISTPPTDSGDGHYANRQLSFSCTEIGDIENESDLWENNFITASEEWWNG